MTVGNKAAKSRRAKALVHDLVVNPSVPAATTLTLSFLRVNHRYLRLSISSPSN